MVCLPITVVTGHDDEPCAKVHVNLATFIADDVFDVNGGSDAPRPAVMAGGRIIIRRTGTSAGSATFDRICQDWTVQRACEAKFSSSAHAF